MAIRVNHKEKALRLPAKSRLASASTPATFAEQLSGAIAGMGKRVKAREVTFFASQLSLMLEVGTSVSSALEALREQSKNPAFKEVIQALVRDVAEGRQLSDAMKRHPRVFDQVFVSMIRAGEAGGFLKEMLERIVEMQEKRRAFFVQARTALTYPIILCIVGAVVVVFVLVGVLPRFTMFFEGKEHLLPWTTRSLMAMSSSVRAYWWAYLLGAVGLAIGWKFWKDSKPGRALLDRFWVSSPIVSQLYNKICVRQMLRTLGHLMASRVSLLEALEVTRSTMKNHYFTHFVDGIMDRVKQGGKFSEPFADYPYIADTVKQMVATGDETGNLPPVMLRIASAYDNEIEEELKTLSSIIEPLGLIIMGIVVGLIVSSIILPLFRIAQTIH
jgi:type II secretory pathway component PulF